MPAQNYISDNPGVQGFEGQQLDALIVLLLAEKAGFTLADDLTDLMNDTACLKCLVDTQLKESLASFLWTQQENGSTASELMAKMNCLNCVDPQTIKALTNYLLVLALT